MPSLSPLSTLIASFMFAGTAGLVTTGRPNAASVGERMNAMRAKAQKFIFPKRGTATTSPRNMVNGKPMKSSRNGTPFSRINDRRSIVDASTKRMSTRVTSTRTRTSGALSTGLSNPTPIGPATIPTETNTIAAEIGERSDKRENRPYPKIKRAAKMKTG